MPGVEGFIYPNEIELQWSVLIVLYPFITGLVAGAFILASLERVFNVEAVKPTYRLALLTALAFLLVAPLPLQLHLGHPERSLEMYLTPHRESAMAMFGFVYLWYLMVVLLVEIWLDYRKDLVLTWRSSTGLKRVLYGILTLGSNNISEEALRIDHRLGYIITVIGIPSAFLLHGYVGFIFGSIKANPWWSTPLMPIVFLFSAIVSGIAAVMLLYVLLMWLKRRPIDMKCLDTIARYLFYAFLIDFSLEMLDLIHRIYEADESFRALDFMVKTRLFLSQIVFQIILGTIVPLALLAITQVVHFSERVRTRIYVLAGVLTLMGIFAMRWNVVIGGQLFSKSFLGYTTYKMTFATREGLLPAILLLILPLVILAGLLRLLPPGTSTRSPHSGRERRHRRPMMSDLHANVEARLQQLEAAISELGRRVETLEQRAAGVEPAAVPTGAEPATAARQPGASAGPERMDVAGLLSLSGRTFMVLGGAYLLRALTESGRLPRGAGIIVGLLYALVWLAAVDRAATGGRSISAAFHGFAAMLIGFPLLWEASTRFAFLGPAASAGALALFAAAVLLVAWRRDLQSVAGMASLAAMGTLFALIVGTGQVAPFAVFAILLGIATLWLGYDRDWYWLRWPAALVADLAVVGLATRAVHKPPLESPELAIAIQLLLLVAYLGSFAARTLVRGRAVIPFEVVQTIAVVVVGVGGALTVARANGVGEQALGLASVLLGIGGYAVAFAFVERRQGLGVNFYFYSTLALVFTLLGVSVLLPTAALTIVVAVLAVIATWLAHRSDRLALALHSAVYVAFGVVVSGMLQTSLRALAGTMTSTATLPASWWAVLLAPLFCLAIPRPHATGASRTSASFARFTIGTIAVVELGGVLVEFLTRLLAGTPPDPGVVATIRTGVLSAAAVALALASRIQKIEELGWLMYPVLLLGMAKLLLEDFPRSQPATLFLALAMYGAALILAPRLAKRPGRPAEATAA